MSVCLVAQAAVAAPLVDSYQSPDIGTDFLSGRWSESFAGGARGAAGNVVHGGSWDGSALYTEWEIEGPELSSVQLLLDDVDGNGDGTRVYRTVYDGGVLRLADDGPWWNAADTPAYTEYVVDLTTYRHTTEQIFEDGQMVTYNASVYMKGTFRDFSGYSVEFLTAVAVITGSGSAIPSDYPAFIDAIEGDWGVVQKIRMEIVPEPATVTLLIFGAAGLAWRRRRRRS